MGGSSSTPVESPNQTSVENIFDDFDEQAGTKKSEGDKRNEPEFKHSIKYSPELLQEFNDQINEQTAEIILQEYELFLTIFYNFFRNI